MGKNKKFRLSLALILVAVVLALLLVPTAAQAGGTPNSDKATNIFIYANDADGNQVLLKVISLDTLKSMAKGRDGTAGSTYYGSFIDAMPTPTYCEGRGVTIPELLSYVKAQTAVADAAALTFQGSDKLYFYSCDSATPVNYTYDALLGVERYYFPLLYQYWNAAEGVVSDTAIVLATKTGTPVYLATESKGGRVFADAGGTNIATYVTENGGVVSGCLTNHLTDEDSLRLVMPQTEANIMGSQPTYSGIRKWIYKICLKESGTSPITSLGTVADPTCVYTLSGTTLTITLSCSDPAAAIYYSDIGGYTQSPLNLYSGPITVENYDVDKPFTLGAIAVREGYAGSTVISASSANISNQPGAPNFTYAMSSDDADPQVGTSFSVSATLAADQDFTLYGAEYRVLIPAAFDVVSISAAAGWEYGEANVNGAVGVTFTHLNATGEAVTASPPLVIGSINLAPLTAGDATLTVDTAIVTREDALAYSSVSAANLTLKVAAEGSGITRGDLNDDGKINSLDAVLLARYRAGLITLTTQQLAAADLNGDAHVNSLDAVLLARYRAGLISTFPAA